MFGPKFLSLGTTLKTDLGRLTLIDGPYQGGEGHGYKAATMRGAPFQFVKVFYKPDEMMGKPYGLSDKEIVRHLRDRQEKIVAARLDTLSPNFAAPTALVTESGLIGVVSKWVELPTSLGNFHQQGGEYLPRLGFLRALAGELARLHASGTAHGDLQEDNIVLDPDNLARWAVLDFGNVALAGAPRPLMLGKDSTMPISLNPDAGMRGYREEIGVATDVFAFAVHAHVLLLGRWDTEGTDSPKEGMQRRVHAVLPGDPLRASKESDGGSGLPFSMLPPRMQRWLGSAYSVKAEDRPGLDEFCRIFDEDMRGNACQCGACGMPFFMAPGRIRCPTCKAEIRMMRLRLPSGSEIRVDRNVHLGRKDLRPSGVPMRISANHLVLSPDSPWSARLYVLGDNGVRIARHTGDRVFIPAGAEEQRVEVGDALIVEDVTCQLVA